MATRLEVFLRAQFGSTIGTGAMGWLIIIGGTCLAGIALPELAAPKHFDVNAAARLDSHLYGGRLLCLVLVIEDPGCLP